MADNIGVDRQAPGQQKRLPHDVAQLPDIARPRFPLKELQCPSGDQRGWVAEVRSVLAQEVLNEIGDILRPAA